MGNVYVFNIGSICIHGKEFFRKFDAPSKIQGIISQWNRCSTYLRKLISEQPDVIYGVKTINWEDSSWKHSSLVGDEQVISLQRTKVNVFSDSVLCLGKIHENHHQTLHGNKDWSGSKHLRNREFWTELTASQWNSSGTFSKDSIRCSSVKKSKVYCWDQARHQRISQEEELYSCRCSKTHLVGIQRQRKRMRIQCSTRFSICKKDLE